MTFIHKKTHLDSQGVIRFGRAEIGVAVVTIVIALSSLVGNAYVSIDRGKATAEEVRTLQGQFNRVEKYLAVTATEVRRNREEVSEVKIALGNVELKIDRMLEAGFTASK